jgi:WD40 repeat protein
MSQPASQTGSAPRRDLRDYLAQAGDLSPTDLVELLCADHAERWRRGERIPVETYLQLHPRLSGDHDTAFELVYSEFMLRETLGDAPTVEEYVWRFPHFGNQLRRQLSLHLALGLADPHESVARSADTLRPRPDPALDSPLLSGWPVLRGYDILGELGRGSMGTVYKARQVSLGRLVALKVVLRGPGDGVEEVERLRGEATAAARLQHPNIVQIHEIGTQDDYWYLALEYIEGSTLQQHLGGRPQNPRQAAQLVETLARAVHFAHERGIIHRDLKPANILLQIANLQSAICNLQSAIPKVTDFGLAKLLDQIGHTKTGDILGSPCYMAPEQARGENRHITPAADVYALGAVLYEMLTGQPPFKAITVLDTLEQVTNRDPVPPRQLQPHTPRDLETICLKCLAKQPRQRYASAAALADDLRRFRTGEPIVARPTPAWERLGRWAKRQPVVAGLSAAVVAIALAGFALVLWQWLRAEGEAGRAGERARGEAQARAAEVQARRLAVEEQARLALYQGQALCDQGEVSRGLLWLARALDLAVPAVADKLEHAIRVNLADWASQLSPTQHTLRHGAPVLYLAFAPDGKTLASVGKSPEVHLWDTATGQEAGPALVHEPRARDWINRLTKPEASPGWIGRIVFNPRDARMAVTTDDDGRAYLWDLVRRMPMGQPLPHAHDHMLWGAAFHPDGRRLVTLCDDGAVRWWDVATHAPIGEPWWHTRTEPGYYTLALSPDGRMLATGGRDCRVIRWNVATGQELKPSLEHDSGVVQLVFSPDGRKLITATRGGTVHVWDARKGRPLDLPAQGREVAGLAVSRDGRLLATGSAGGIVRLWDTATWRPVGQTCTYPAPVTALAFRPDGRILAIGQDDGTVRLTALPQVRAVGSPLQVGADVQHLAYSRDGRRLLTGTPDGARWWDLTTGRPSGPLMHGETPELRAGLHDLLIGRQYGPREEAYGTAYAPDGRTVATVRSSGTEGWMLGRAELWDAATGKLIGQTLTQPEPLRGVAYSPDGRSILTWCNTPARTVLWDAATLRPRLSLLRGLRGRVRQAVFSQDGQTLLLGCDDGRARFWDPVRDQEIDPGHCPTHAYPITAVAYGPRGDLVATGCHAGTVRLWEVASRKMLGDLRGSAGEIAALAFSPDGSVVLTGSLDGTARFWDVATGSSLGPPLRHANAVLSVAFHPDGETVATGSKDGRARRWRVPSAPRAGDVEEVRTWVEVLTGQELTDDPIGVRAQGVDALRERRERMASREP